MTANAGSIGETPSNNYELQTSQVDLDNGVIDASTASDIPASVSLGSENNMPASEPTEAEQRVHDKQVSTASSLSAASIDVLDVTKVETVQQPQVEPTKSSNKSISSKTTDKPPPPPSGQTAPANSNNNVNKNPFEAFNEYVAFFFRKAEAYEEVLERRESKVDLRANMEKVASMDQVHHGAATLRYNGSRIELAAEENDAGVVQNGDEEHQSSPRLSPTSEAIAAVEAISNFRSLTEVRKEYKESRSHSVGTDSDSPSAKKQKSMQPQKDVEDAAVEEGEDFKGKWDEFCTKKKQNAFGEVAIENISLSLTVQEFHELVLKDNATNSIGKFMTDIGDMDVEATAWEPQAGQPTTRTIHYIHPVNAPMAPPTAKAFKTQYLHKFGDVGLCLESSTIVEDVPMTDCFVVDDRLWVSQDKKTRGCIVNVMFQIRFVKTTMFRRIIENATRSEFQKWWTQFGEMVSALQGAASIQALPEEEDLEVVATELEEVTILLEGECNDDEAARDALKKIRSTIKRLSMVAKRASVRHMNETLMKQGSGYAEIVYSAHQILVASVGKSISYLRDIGESENVGVGAFVLLFGLGMMNLWTYRQLVVTNELLSDMGVQLKQLSVANELLLSKLPSATCSN